MSLSHTRDANTPYNTTRHNTVQRNIEYKRLQSVPEQCLFQENTSSRHPAKYKTHFSQSALSPVQHPSVLPPTNDLDQRKHMALDMSQNTEPPPGFMDVCARIMLFSRYFGNHLG